MIKLNSNYILYEGKLVRIKGIRKDTEKKCDVFVLDNEDGTLLDTRLYMNGFIVNDNDEVVYLSYKGNVTPFKLGILDDLIKGVWL